MIVPEVRIVIYLGGGRGLKSGRGRPGGLAVVPFLTWVVVTQEFTL